MTTRGDVIDAWGRLITLSPFVPGTEERRLAALRTYDILDTDPEEAYERVVDLACALFDVPVATVGFVDEAREWYKARRGVDMTSTPRDLTACDHLLRHDGVLVVPDLSLDPRFVGNPHVHCENGIRFYAGAPLLSPGGEKVGAVCVMAIQPRHDFGALDTQRLAALAGIVEHELELRVQGARANRLAAERGMMLQALAHRMRGCLQLVSCVLEAQAGRSDSEAGRRALYEAADRVATIEAVQHQLFQASDLMDVDARAYLLALVGNLQDSLVDAGGGRAIRFDLPATLAMEAARLPALGLVVTELLANALRHGTGDVQLAVRLDRGTVVVAVSDDGAGFPADFDVGAGGGMNRLGLRLVSMLALPGGLQIDPRRRQAITVRMAA